MITKILASTAVLTLSTVALAIGVAAPASAAGNNVVNAHCDDIVLDLKDNPMEADSRGVVAVNVNGRVVYTGPIDTADYHKVVTGFPRHDTGYEWTVTITHPYTGGELFHTYGDVQCQPATQPEQPTIPAEPIQVDVPLPESSGQAQVPEEFPTQIVIDVDRTVTGQQQKPAESSTTVVDVPKQTFTAQTPTGSPTATTDVPNPTFTATTPEEFGSTAVTDVPLSTFSPQAPTEYPTTTVADVPFQTFDPQAPLEPTVVTVPVPVTGGSIDITPTLPTTPDTNVSTPIDTVDTTGHTPDTNTTSTNTPSSNTPAQPTAGVEQPSGPTAAGGIPTDSVLPNLGGPTAGLTVAGAGLLAGGIILIQAARRRTN